MLWGTSHNKIDSILSNISSNIQYSYFIVEYTDNFLKHEPFLTHWQINIMKPHINLMIDRSRNMIQGCSLFWYTTKIKTHHSTNAFAEIKTPQKKNFNIRLKLFLLIFFCFPAVSRRPNRGKAQYKNMALKS